MLQQAMRQRIVRLSPEQLASLAFEPVPSLPLEHAPATPAAHEPLPKPLEALSPPSTPPVVPPAVSGRPAGSSVYPLRLEDVGCMIRAELRPRSGAAASAAVVSNAVGPVEPGPPRSRLIWVEGAPVVGGLLLGRYLYFGGVEGPSEVSWLRVAPDGSSSTVKGPLPLDAAAGMPPKLASEPTEEGDGHPCAFRLRAEDEGCVFKFRVHPIRADGDEGHTEAARARAKIGAAPADGELQAAEAEAAAAAPTILAARAWDAHKAVGGVAKPWPGGASLGGEDWVAVALERAAAIGV